MLFCDNLDSQVHPDFLAEVKRLGGLRYLLPAGETEMCQPIDAGIGAALKQLIAQAQDDWLDDEDNLDAWEGCDESKFVLTAKMRRILITHWVGDAWERLTTHPDYHDTFKRCFETTGALITANGSRDELINPLKGMTTYKVPNDVPLPAPPTEEELNYTEATAEENDEEDEDIPNDDEDPGDVVFAEDPNNNNTPSVTTTEKDWQELENDSWEEALIYIQYTLDPPKEVVPAERLRRFPDKGHAILFIDGEWNVVKLCGSVGSEYRFVVECTHEYGLHKLNPDHYGTNKDNPSPSKWVLLKQKMQALKCNV